MKTKAAVLYEYGQPLVIDYLDVKPCLEGEVLVRFKAAGLCRTDLSVIKGNLPLPIPCVPGHEGAGVVEEAGPNVTKVKKGDHVVLLWIPSCGECYYCKRDQPYLCVKRDVTRSGTMLDGTYRLQKNGLNINKLLGVGSFSEFNVVNQESLMPIGSDIPFDAAAVAGCSVITGFGAVFNTAKVKAGSSVAIIGIGAVGVNIIQGSFLANATKIIAIDVLDRKLEIARQFGATHVINAGNEDVLERITEITGGIGVDFAFEALGRPETILSAFDMIRSGGSAVVVGIAHSQQKVEIPVSMLPRAEKNLLGCCYGSSVMSRDLETIFDLYRNKRLRIDESITKRYSLDEINDGFAELEAGNNIRAVVTF